MVKPTNMQGQLRGETNERNDANEHNVGNTTKPCPTTPVNLPKGAYMSLEIRAVGHSLEGDIKNDKAGWPSDHHSLV